MATQKNPWCSETRKNDLKKTQRYIDAKESLVYGSNDEYLKKCDWVSSIIEGCT
jgi:hypothetical protein